MCGIFGFIGRVNAERWGTVFDILTALALETEERGAHATGYAAIDSKNFITAKAPLAARAFVGTDAWRALAEAPQEVVIGHCRYATSGEPRENANNHPHVGARFALVHNGILAGHTAIAKAEKVRVSSDCDSEVLLRVVEKRGAVAGVRRLFSDVLGGLQRSAACAVLDKRDGSLHLFRSVERPLHVVRLPDFDDAVVFASTPEILARALSRVLGKVPVSGDWSALPGRLYVFNLNGGARPEAKTYDMPMRILPSPPRPGHLFDDMFDEMRSDAFPAEPVAQDWPAWTTYHCTGCGTVISQRETRKPTCYKCGGGLEEIENAKTCHDCSARLPSSGPSRCQRCADRRREQQQKNRKAVLAGAGGGR